MGRIELKADQKALIVNSLRHSAEHTERLLSDPVAPLHAAFVSLVAELREQCAAQRALADQIEEADRCLMDSDEDKEGSE